MATRCRVHRGWNASRGVWRSGCRCKEGRRGGIGSGRLAPQAGLPLFDRDDHIVYGFAAGVLRFVRYTAPYELHVAAFPCRFRRFAVDR